MNVKSKVVKGVQSLSAYQPGKPESELKRELGLHSIIKLASNENPLGCSPLVQRSLQDSLSNHHDLAIYPDGSGHSLKNALVEYLSAHENLSPINAQQITLGSGSNDVLDMIVRVFADSDAEVIMSQYAFAVYYISTQAVGAKAVVVNAADDYGHNLNAMFDAITPKTKLIFIANPNNPTGNSLTFDEIMAFINRVPSHIIVVVDEAYSEYLSPQEPSLKEVRSVISELPNYDNLIITRTFSKIYGLASLRVGYALSSVVVADYLNRVRHPFNVNSMALIAAESALQDQGFVTRSCQLNFEQKQVWYKSLDEMNLKYIATAGNFITVDFMTQENAEALNQYLLKKGIIVRTLTPYQMPSFLRITIGNAEQNQSVIDAIKSFMKSHNN